MFFCATLVSGTKLYHVIAGLIIPTRTALHWISRNVDGYLRRVTDDIFTLEDPHMVRQFSRWRRRDFGLIESLLPRPESLFAKRTILRRPLVRVIHIYHFV